LPYPDNSFDSVHCSHIIEHLFPKDAHKLLTEIDRVLRVNGILCLRTPLLHKGFYNDFTHIKPYNPEAIIYYLNVGKIDQLTLKRVKGVYKLIKLKYRRNQLFLFLRKTPFWFLGIIFNILYRFGLSGIAKTGYMLVLKKIG